MPKMPYLLNASNLLAISKMSASITTSLLTATPEAVSALAPAFVLHLASPNDTAHQVHQWLPYPAVTFAPRIMQGPDPLPRLPSERMNPPVQRRDQCHVRELEVVRGDRWRRR